MDKLLSFLGLARRAGKLSLGNDPVLEAMTKQEAKLVLTACDLSPRTLRNIEGAATRTNTPLRQIAVPMDELGFALGKRVGVVAVNDNGFAVKIEQLCDPNIPTGTTAGE